MQVGNESPELLFWSPLPCTAPPQLVTSFIYAEGVFYGHTIESCAKNFSLLISSQKLTPSPDRPLMGLCKGLHSTGNEKYGTKIRRFLCRRESAWKKVESKNLKKLVASSKTNLKTFWKGQREGIYRVGTYIQISFERNDSRVYGDTHMSNWPPRHCAPSPMIIISSPT